MLNRLLRPPPVQKACMNIFIQGTLSHSITQSKSNIFFIQRLSPLLSSFDRRHSFHASAPLRANKKDYYDVLGVSKNSSKTDIKKAYYRLAKKYHPDAATGASEKANKENETKFSEAQEAYEILSDDEKRSAYDQYGHRGVEGMNDGSTGGFQGASAEEIFKDFFKGGGGGGGGGGFEDLFHQHGRSGHARQPQQGSHVQMDISISFMDAVRGTERAIDINTLDDCPECSGTGAKKGSTPAKCSGCGGSGVVRAQAGFFQIQQTCPRCGGEGKVVKEKCPSCKEGKVRSKKTVKVTIPPGVDSGVTVRLAEKGDSGLMGGPRGHLFVKLRVLPHERFRRNGNDVLVDVPVSLTDAIMGGVAQVPVLEGGHETVVLPPGIQSNHEQVLRGQGVRDIATKKRGDLHASFKVRIPSYSTLAPSQQEAVRVLAGLVSSTSSSTPSSTSSTPSSTSSSTSSSTPHQGPSSKPTTESSSSSCNPPPSPDSGNKGKGLFGRLKESLCKEGSA